MFAQTDLYSERAVINMINGEIHHVMITGTSETIIHQLVALTMNVSKASFRAQLYRRWKIMMRMSEMGITQSYGQKSTLLSNKIHCALSQDETHSRPYSMLKVKS